MGAQPGAFGSTAVSRSAAMVDYSGAAGCSSGTRYEVVHKYTSANFQGTAPFASNSPEWLRSVAHFGMPRAGPHPKAMHLSDAALFEAQRHAVSQRFGSARAPSPAGRGASGTVLRAAAAATMMQGAAR